MHFCRNLRKAPVAAVLALCCLAVAWAQPARTVDYVVALVNSEPITNAELEAAVARVGEQLRAQGQPMPPADMLRKGVLERMIGEKAQLQYAEETGIRVDDAAVEQAEQTLARQSQLSVEAFRERAAHDGLGLEALHRQLREQLMLNRLRERDVDARVRVTDQDVDKALAEQKAGTEDPLAQEFNLAHLLIAVPERADAAETQRRQELAEQLLRRARSGEDFSALVRQYSGADRGNGGEMGLRRGDRYPVLFVQATRNLPVGAISGVVRSPAGFHILKVVERRQPQQPDRFIEKTHARHILLRIGPQLTQEMALAKLADLRQRVVEGRDDFAALARRYSHDGSAAQGGDLGWATPGTFVPEFEEVLAHLKEGELSLPMMSRFGAHLIQLVERKRVELSAQELRELVRNQLRASKAEEAFVNWAKDLRERAFVEYRDPPQ